MAQLPHLQVGDVPIDITAGLTDGCYVAQPRGDLGALGVLYATALSAPADLDDWFSARAGSYFSFQVADGGTPTWVVTATPGTVVVAVASV